MVRSVEERGALGFELAPPAPGMWWASGVSLRADWALSAREEKNEDMMGVDEARWLLWRYYMRGRS